ncbi:O-antigen polymerase [Bilifractor sp. HCP3S3_D3]|uniref:O-antigen polymerase n=1 Tax=Bilifractor sp. HCP3S3_D3 TaxID=3438907 RepID=UPI003F897E0C
MASLIILFIPLMALMFLSLHEFEYLLSPSFAFVVGFVLQVFFCFFYTKEWSINLGSTTVGAIILGCFTFFVTSWVLENSRVRFVISKKKWRSGYAQENEEILPFEIENWKLIIFIVMQLLTLAGYVLFMNSNMPGGNLAAKIYYYRSQTADFGRVIEIPQYLSFFRLTSSAIGYCLIYVLAYNLVNKFKQNSIIVLINLILSLLLEGILGARGGMFNFIVAFFGVYFLLGYKYDKIHISFKLLVRVIIAGIAIVSLLPILGIALGRPAIKGASYETAVYIGGPLINLDTFIKRYINWDGIHYSTFSSLFNDFSNLFSEKFLAEQTPSMPWNFINGNSIGNVYTAFSSYWYDLGWFGVFILPLLSSIIMHVFYKLTIGYKKKRIPMSAVLYSYFIPCILFSFFSNRFFNQLISLYFVKFVIAVIFVRLFIDRITISKPIKY